MRNAASHTERQDVMPLGAVLRVLRETAHDINRASSRATSVGSGSLDSGWSAARASHNTGDA